MSSRISFVLAVIFLLSPASGPGGKQAQQPQPQQPIPSNPAPPVTPPQAPQVQAQTHPPEQQSDWRHEAFGAKNWSSWAVVLVALWTGIVASRSLAAIEEQGRHMERQADLLEQQIANGSDATQRQLRAYISLQSAVLDWTEPAFPTAHLVFKNCGQTPAYHVEGWIHSWIADHPLQERLPMPPSNLEKASNTIGPGASNSFTSPQQPALPAHTIRDLGSGAVALYVYGEFTYRDAFGYPRCTRYRLIFGGPAGKTRALNDDGRETWILSPDMHGNECD